MAEALCCAVCDASGPEIAAILMQFRCGHVLCPQCQHEPCPACESLRHALDEESPLEQAIFDGKCVLWAYGELYDASEESREDYAQFVMVLTCLRLWATSVCLDASAAWREAYVRGEAITQAQKVRE